MLYSSFTLIGHSLKACIFACEILLFRLFLCQAFVKLFSIGMNLFWETVSRPLFCGLNSRFFKISRLIAVAAF